MMRLQPESQDKHTGFTLLEMSIVLAIVGMIIAGIFAGQTLIHAALIQKAIAQIDQFNSATNSFYVKYNCLPGDCDHATQFGFSCYNPSAENCQGQNSANGNGDGQINTLVNGYGSNVGEENLNFWVHLYEAGLIPQPPCYHQNSGNCSLSFSPYYGVFTPQPAITQSTSISSHYGVGILNLKPYAPNTNPLYMMPGNHAFYFSGMSFDTYPVVLPADVYAIDSKLDDGLPLSGNVRGEGSRNYISLEPSDRWGTGGCVTLIGSNYQYNLTSTGATYDAFCTFMWTAAF